MTSTSEDLTTNHDYYCRDRTVDGAELSVYEMWEAGRAFGDSITPAVHDPAYRAHITALVAGLTPPGGCVLSLGCGNGFVEGELVGRGRRVRAIDCNEEAVVLARSKGVHASTADVLALGPEDGAGVDVVYADGLFGHLFDADSGLDVAIAALVRAAPGRGVHLVISNDPPRDPTLPYEPHERVEGFWFISERYLRRRLEAFGFASVTGSTFPYRRPVSGWRDRMICTARFP